MTGDTQTSGPIPDGLSRNIHQSDCVEDTDATWHDVQQAWSEGNLQAARTYLSCLIENEITENADTWRLWGDRAAALRDLHLAARAYEQARLCLPPGQPSHRWLTRYLYARLQAAAAPQEIEKEYRAAWLPLTPPKGENRLVDLAFETDLHYHLGNMPQAVVAGKELLEQWLDASDTVMEMDAPASKAGRRAKWNMTPHPLSAKAAPTYVRSYKSR
jgi:hypothetical protein